MNVDGDKEGAGPDHVPTLVLEIEGGKEGVRSDVYRCSCVLLPVDQEQIADEP